VAPTKALVNDLYERLLKYLGVKYPGIIARYTGDRHEYTYAEGTFCVLATPEALDSLQLRHPELLQSVRSIVVDEIHLLHGQARGQQLRHVIDRIRAASGPPRSARDNFQIVGMTATLHDMPEVASLWLGEGAVVLSQGTPREIDLELVDVAVEDRGQADRAKSIALVPWLERTGAEKVLVFANSRNGAHSLAAYLHQRLAGTRWPVHLHFGALPASQRERVEEHMRADRFGVCVATSTLEIGIDIGDIDAVVLADIPRSVSGFLQRIGRGNRRTGLCRVVGFRSSEDDEQLLQALVDCSRRGDLDDVYEYDRPSVRFQQVLSLAWRATREDRSLTVEHLACEAGTDKHTPVVIDMLATGCLIDLRGALVPSDRFIDEGDSGRIHTVISGGVGNSVVDLRTGDTAFRDADETSRGGALFHAGTLRRLMAGVDGTAYLGETANKSDPLARVKTTGPALPMSRSIIWALARRHGYDPARWQLNGGTLLTWGGKTLNDLLADLFRRAAPNGRFSSTPTAVVGDMSAIDLSLEAIGKLAKNIEARSDLPISATSKFVGPSRFMTELSDALAAEERRRSVPWRLLHSWLEQVNAIDSGGPPLTSARGSE
jgi:ATP-dependent Lhr-like helicase